MKAKTITRGKTTYKVTQVSATHLLLTPNHKAAHNGMVAFQKPIAEYNRQINHLK